MKGSSVSFHLTSSELKLRISTPHLSQKYEAHNVSK